MHCVVIQSFLLNGNAARTQASQGLSVTFLSGRGETLVEEVRHRGRRLFGGGNWSAGADVSRTQGLTVVLGTVRTTGDGAGTLVEEGLRH